MKYDSYTEGATVDKTKLDRTRSKNSRTQVLQCPLMTND